MKKFKPHKPPKVNHKPNALIQQGTSGEELDLHNTIRMLLPNTPTFRGDRVILHGREIDILIPSHKIGIEYDGLFYHSGDSKDSGYHLWKTEEAERAGYRLIHIWSDLWENRRTQTVDFLSKLFGRYTLLPIDKCIVAEISEMEGRSFLEASHILGVDPHANKYFGIYYEGRLVTVASFLQEEEKWTLLRLSDRRTLRVERDISSIINYIRNKYLASRVFAKVDRSLFSKQDFPDFKLKTCTEPHVLWTKDFKSRRFQENKSDVQMKKSGYEKFYDCGDLILEYKEKPST